MSGSVKNSRLNMRASRKSLAPHRRGQEPLEQLADPHIDDHKADAPQAAAHQAHADHAGQQEVDVPRAGLLVDASTVAAAAGRIRAAQQGTPRRRSGPGRLRSDAARPRAGSRRCRRRTRSTRSVLPGLQPLAASRRRRVGDVNRGPTGGSICGSFGLESLPADWTSGRRLRRPDHIHRDLLHGIVAKRSPQRRAPSRAESHRPKTRPPARGRKSAMRARASSCQIGQSHRYGLVH